MRAPRVSLAIVTILLAPIAAAAQTTTAGTGIDQALDALFGTFSLPQTVTAAREAGVADSTIGGVLDRIRRSGLPAAEAEDVLEQEVEVVRFDRLRDCR